MEQDLLGLAFGAGLVAALNPCGFALLPGYLALVVRGENAATGARALGRAALATVAMAAGFVAVFGTFTALTVATASTVQRYLPYVTVVIGLILVCLGIWLLAGRRLGVLMPNSLADNPRWAPTARMGSMLGYGVGYALASLSCTIGPFLAVTGAGLRSGTPLRGVGVFASYAAGFTLVVGVLAVATALARTVVIDRMRRILPYANRISGALLILVGAYVGYYGLYEVRLFSGSGDPHDPVIAAAGKIQGTLAGWVHQHGALPWAIGLLVLIGLGLLWRVRIFARRSPARRATADDAP
ncbi:cytochrome c biogenesis CcdA family protein [Mycolicibacterium smegmatis]|uniref:Conserved integral membrane protein n=3 Tax=Mycolicibacterium smegmatis TaxID=1772 RepID=I7GBL4_MYCS2|nr:cytochrome c biogenesis CcdA family protein [Mycolicibacterium smegmatis]ABK70431.1 cytochrome C biogenesis protein transmembrane region [Mycolicibacterium smegmatis MC2 155]AFP39924.1 Conserved integral membrane protein [Mycolicibacterium smegmatis MC2 155]AIU08680.1 membrane protein [Mycolicibacterium smegmatis MC2 155]AIU15305.1 membrane protein [Mycolicibacterium smegmatis]AIU21928.1 membrane protein [Mycolicibacterium smegmatis]